VISSLTLAVAIPLANCSLTYSLFLSFSCTFPDPNKVMSPVAAATVPESHHLPLSPMKKTMNAELRSDPPVVNTAVSNLEKELAQAKQDKKAAETRATTAEKDAMTAKEESDTVIEGLRVEYATKMVSLQGELAEANEDKEAAETRATTAEELLKDAVATKKETDTLLDDLRVEHTNTITCLQGELAGAKEAQAAAESRATAAEESATAAEARAAAADEAQAAAMELLTKLKGGATAHTLIVEAEARYRRVRERYATVLVLLETAEAELAARDAANA